MEWRRIQVPERAAPVVGFGRRMYNRTLEIDGVDRAIAIGALAFTSMFPLLIVYSALLSPGDGEAIAGRLIERFELNGATADSIDSAFQAPAGTGTATFIGAVLVVLTALSFTRAMQRLYESAWSLDRKGMRGSGWGLLWLAGLVSFLFAQPGLDQALIPGLHLAVSLVLAGGLWLMTPYLLLGRRVHYRQLFQSAAISAVAMTAAEVVSVLAMPRIVEESSEQFGTIGVAFALLTWLTSLAMVVMAATVVGAELAGRPEPGEVAAR